MQVGAGLRASLAHDLGDVLGAAPCLRRYDARDRELALDEPVSAGGRAPGARIALTGRLVRSVSCCRNFPAVTLRSVSQLERLKNGVEMGPGDLVAPLAILVAHRPAAGLLRGICGLAKPGKTTGFLHGWVVLGVTYLRWYQVTGDVGIGHIRRLGIPS